MPSVSISTIHTTLSALADDHDANMRRLAERATDLSEHARHGYQLVSTATVPGNELTTLVDTLQKVEA